MKIIDLLLNDNVIDKLIWKHNISELEVRQLFNNQPNIRFIEKGKINPVREDGALNPTLSKMNIIFFIIFYHPRHKLGGFLTG